MRYFMMNSFGRGWCWYMMLMMSSSLARRMGALLAAAALRPEGPATAAISGSSSDGTRPPAASATATLDDLQQQAQNTQPQPLLCPSANGSNTCFNKLSRRKPLPAVLPTNEVLPINPTATAM
jgi:hypothetical protein